MINSKKKGNRIELEIVHILNEYYQTDVFERVPSSGARATSSKSLTKHKANILIGDIIVPEEYPYFFEVKGYKDEPNLWKVLESGLFLKEWEEERNRQFEQIKVTNKLGIILAFKANKREWLGMIENQHLNYNPRNPVSFMRLVNDRMIMKLEDLLNCLAIDEGENIPEIPTFLDRVSSLGKGEKETEKRRKEIEENNENNS